MLLPPERRRHVYAVYALCRLADDIVDAPSATQGDNVPRDHGRALAAFRDEVGAVLDGGPTDDPVLAAIGDSFARCAIPRENVDRFFRAMAQDLTTTTYETWDDLVAYMEGSAAVIGEMMLPVLRPRSPEAFEPARALGFAFQLTNFLRDVGEDLDRGRVYVPQEDLRRFGADPWAREVTPAWRELMRFEIARNRELYAQADTGIPMLPPSVGPMRRHRPGAVRADPRADRVAGLRRVHRAGARCIMEQGDDVGPDPRRRAAPDTATEGLLVTASSRFRAELKRRYPIQNVPTVPHEHLRSTWKQARPGRIRASFDVAQSQDPGGWYVVGRSGDVGTEPLGDPDRRRPRDRALAGRGRDADGRARAPARTSGALLDDCEVIRGDVVCRWHGMALGADGPGRLEAGRRPRRRRAGVGAAADAGRDAHRPADAHRRGRRSTPRSPPSSRSPASASRRTSSPTGSTRGTGRGTTRMRSATSSSTTTPSDDKVLVVDVTFRLTPRLGVPVRAEFACPDARTIVMTIVDGEGAGSVVETHATPIAPDPWGRPRTMMTEATIAHSPRTGFRHRPGGRGAGEAADEAHRRPALGATTWPTPSAATSCAPRRRRPTAPDPRLQSDVPADGPLRRSGDRPVTPCAVIGTVQRSWPGRPHRDRWWFAAIQPVVAARSISATG